MSAQDVDWTFEVTYDGADCEMNILTAGNTTYLTARTWSIYEYADDVEAFRAITNDDDFIQAALDVLGEAAYQRQQKPEPSSWGAL